MTEDLSYTLMENRETRRWRACEMTQSKHKQISIAIVIVLFVVVAAVTVALLTVSRAEETITGVAGLQAAPHQTTLSPDETTQIPCPQNMVYGVCSCGQRSCQEPTTCQNTCEGDNTVGCICPDGFYTKGDDCVSEEECGCYVIEEQAVIQEGVTHVDAGCTRVAVCINGTLTRNEHYECSPDAVCEERDGVRKCYCNDGFSGDGETCTEQTDCMDVYNFGLRTSGVYSIKPANWSGSSFSVYCNMTERGGWTVFQRRIDGSVDFFLEWDSYSEGFGDITREHWLGNDKLHYLTSQKRYKIRIDLIGRDDMHYYATYDFFRIDNKDALYRLSGLGTYRGNADERYNADGKCLLTYYHNRPFSTRDRDNDADPGNMARHFKSAWWYNDYDSGYGCPYTLNGRYWDYFHISWLPGNNDLNFSEMKLLPV